MTAPACRRGSSGRRGASPPDCDGLRFRRSQAVCHDRITAESQHAMTTESARTSARTLYDKIWDAHVVDRQPDGTCLLYIDRHLVH